MEQNAPLLRFPGFSGKWEEKKVKDIFDYVIDKNHPNEEVLTIKQGIGTVPRAESGIDITFNKDSLPTYKLVQKDDFIVHLRTFQAGLEIANSKGIVSPAYTILRNKIPIAPMFYRNYFRSYKFIHENLSKVIEGIRDGKTVNINDLKNRPVPFPSLPEQEKIADFFSALDEKIDLKEKEIEDVKALKKGFLQQMFPQDEESVPRLRFPGFSGAWEKKALREITKIIDPHPSHRAPKATIQGIPFIGIGDIDEYGNINYKTSRIVSAEVYDEQHKRINLDIPSIGIGRVASVGKIVRLRNNIGKYAISPTLCIVQFNSTQTINYEFAFSSMQTEFFQQQFKVKSNGSTRQSVGIENVRITNIMFSSLSEQEKIADFFSALDAKIDAMEKQLKNLKEMKKGFLQQMFI